MTKAELTMKLFDQFQEETEDVYEYEMLSKEAMKHNMPHLAKGLKEIAEEEYTHAKFLAKVLGDEADQPPHAATIWHKWHAMLADIKNS